MSSSDVSLATDGVTVVNAALLNSYRAAIAAVETGATPLNNTSLTGTPTAPTAAGATNTNQVATTAFVHGEISSALPTAAMGDLLAGNGSNQWASLSATSALDGDALIKDHTASFGIRWGSVAQWPGGATRGSMIVHDNASSWGTVTPTADNQLVVSDDADGFGVKFAGINALPTATQKSDYAALTTDPDRIAYIASYLGLV